MFLKAGLVGYLPPPLLLEKQNINNFEKGCEYYARNKGKLSGHVPHYNFYFVALPVFLVKWFSIRFQFSITAAIREHAPLTL